MGFFSGDKETKRKLKELEDKRLRFVEKAGAIGYDPDTVLMVFLPDGRTAALSSGRALIIPRLDDSEEYTLFDVRLIGAEKHHVAPEGLGGALGMGKRGESGFILRFECADETELRVPIATGLSNFRIYDRARNIILSPARRRGDAHPAWDLMPVEKGDFKKIRSALEAMYGSLPEIK